MKKLDSYLNDHLAGSVGALELIAYCAHLYDGKPLGAFFTKMKAQIGTDQYTLRRLMRRLGIEESKVRQAGARAGEKLGRALFTIAGSEPDGLGLLLVLEGLIMGVVGKRLLWRSLAAIAPNFPALQGTAFSELEKRAHDQFERVETLRIEMAREAFRA